MTTQTQTAPAILRRKNLETRLGLSRSTIYAKLKYNPKRPSDFDPSFPQPIPLGRKAVGWLEAEVDDWLMAQAASRGGAQ